MADEAVKDKDITELTQLDATKVSAVNSPANGTPWLLVKSAAKADMLERAGGSEAAEIQEEMTGTGDNDAWKGICDEPDQCDICKEAVAAMPEAEKAKLTSAERKKLPKGKFAVPAKRGYPIQDKSHARNALSRVSQFGSADEKAQVRSAVARKYPGIGRKDAVAQKALDDINAAIGPVEKSPGVPDFSVAMPREAGHIHDTATSGTKIEPMTGRAALVGVRGDGGLLPGGATPYPIPAEADAFKATAVASLLEAMDAIAAGREATKDSKELIDILGRLGKSEHEQQETDEDPDDAAKAGRKLSAKNTAALTQAAAYISAVLQGATPGSTSPKEDTIVTELTKEELTAAIAQASTAAVKSALKAERKAAKAKAKADKESANNKGEVSEGEMASQVHGTHDADDVNAVKETATTTTGKSKTDKLVKETAAGLMDVKGVLERIEGNVAKALARKAGGGPILTGALLGNHPAAEGRTTEVSKSTPETDEIAKLEKSLEDELVKSGPEAAVRAAEIGQRLTLARLYAAHESGKI